MTKTRYEWTQQQRKLETAVRRQKDIANTSKAAGDDVLRREAQYKIERYQAAYDRITNKALLTADRGRMRVSGFSSVKAADDETMRLLRIERQRKTRLTNKPSLALPGADKATAAEAKFTKYLFNPEKPDGYAKGVAFESRLGYNIKNWEQLRKAILEAAKLYPASVKSQSPYGTKYEQKIILH
ncbi:MAG TPA: minor capsid protein, partial [Candidatus Alectryocaccomicrobium excrementavium]|nr:minor capsid protein [Candidatus Alectryocaccomicrobium excrementavium]